jgi:phosphoglycerate dehydrogenase-like enzyme
VLSFDRKAVTQAAKEIATVDWLGGYRRPPNIETARSVVAPHLGTSVQEALDHGAQVYIEAFQRWLLHPHESPKRAAPRTPRVYARWCD